MNTLIRSVALGTLILAAAAGLTASPADASGTWNGTVATQDGEYALVYVFKQEGAKLSGKLQTPQETVEIQEGKVDGDKISFACEVNYNGSLHLRNEGTLQGDEIALTITHEGGGNYKVTLKRQK